MLHALIIAIIGVIALHDAFPALFAPDRVESGGFGSMLTASMFIALLLSIFVDSAVWICGRRLDRTGAVSAIRTAERAVKISRVAAVVAYGWLVLRAGFLDVTRAAIGDMVIIDEAIVVTPTLLVFIAGWWSMYPIDRRLHDAGLVARLDEGRPVSAMPSRFSYVLDRVRHDLLLLLAPIALILAWSEIVQFALDDDPWSGHPQGPGALQYVLTPWLQLLGAVVILALAPIVIRLLWRTTPIAPGPIRNRLTALCERQGVRFRQILVWKTHGLMINGAVLGFIAPVRYVLLTDALLESLPEDQVEAVMAHEVGHVRRRHMPWLLASLVVGLGIASMVMTLLSEGVLAIVRALGWPADPLTSILEVATLLIAVIAGLLTFGFVSRRFERQADAFAVQHISGLTRRNDPGAGLVCQPDAADAMAGALASVADLNHIPSRRWTWRHGSIAGRQHAIGILIGQPVEALPIDTVCRAIKRWLIAGFVVMALLAFVTMLVQGALG
ncbi:MAG: M48 family metalloprotease [Phycisphaeraceae bacterium]|nr:M48 family metalloprotease [Phycisphaeraceae bacterium]